MKFKIYRQSNSFQIFHFFRDSQEKHYLTLEATCPTDPTRVPALTYPHAGRGLIQSITLSCAAVVGLSRHATLSFTQATLESRGTHDVTVYDPVDVFGEGGALAESGGELRTPHFFFAQGAAPVGMEAMREVIKAADCYLVVSPEYNHT